MRWGLTGTPGTGKTTVTETVTCDLQVVHLHDLLQEPAFRAGEDPERDTVVADLDALATWLEKQPDDLLVESHLAHLLPVDRVIVLRCHPDRLDERLRARSGVARAKREENVEAERLDLILSEAIDRFGMEDVFEVDTTDRDPAEVAAFVEDIIAGTRDAPPGRISFLSEP